MNDIAKLATARSTVSEKNELIKICLIYRYISLAISTFIYYLMCNGNVTPIRIGIASGMIFASVIGAHIYRKSFSNGARFDVIITMCLEAVAYGVFIVVSGGFSSPYLWHFISSFTVIMAAGRYDARFRIAAPISVAWGVLCAVAGELYGVSPGYIVYPRVNIGFAFLVVTGGFYTLFIYVGKLDKNRHDLNRLNESLQRETMSKEQTLKHTMDIYESFNLFSITDPGKVMDEITALLYRTIAADGCLLLKISPLREIENIGSSGIPEWHVATLIGRVAELRLISAQLPEPDPIELSGYSYAVTYINSSSGIQGILITPAKETAEQQERDSARESFYLGLAGILLQELDLHATVESYIISEEQNRIANEIHDTVIQKLFAVVCSLRLLYERQDYISSDENREQIKYISKAIESTMRELREAIYGLRWDLDGQNLFDVKLSLYMDEIKTLSGATINLNLDRHTQHMTAKQNTVFYRIICEAVNNAIHHGKATELNVEVSLRDEELIAEISDNGNGFDPSMRPVGGQGIKNMYKMANLLKGHLSIESQIGKGTTIRCSLPK